MPSPAWQQDVIHAFLAIYFYYFHHIGFTVLPVHDEFIVPVDMVEAVHEVRYTMGFEGL